MGSNSMGLFLTWGMRHYRLTHALSTLGSRMPDLQSMLLQKSTRLRSWMLHRQSIWLSQSILDLWFVHPTTVDLHRPLQLVKMVHGLQ